MSEPTCRELLDAITEYHADENAEALASRVERVLALHKHIGSHYCDVCEEPGWPCKTVRLLNGEEP